VDPTAGGPAPGARPPAPPKPAAPGERPPSQEVEQKLTRIDYEDYMFTNNQNNLRTSKFLGNVEVYHVPADNPDVAVDKVKVPKGGIYLNSDVLHVWGRPLADGKTSQMMRAEKKVRFRTQEFFGLADVVTYDEGSDQVTFEGSAGNPARLF